MYSIHVLSNGDLLIRMISVASPYSMGRDRLGRKLKVDKGSPDLQILAVFVTAFIVKERAIFPSKHAHAFSWRARAEGHLR